MKLDELPEDLLINILDSAEKPSLIPQSCKQFQLISQKILSKKWSVLKSLSDKYYISRAINIINLPEDKKPTYKDFSKLYSILAEYMGSPITKENDLDITNVELYLEMNEKIQMIQDRNLILIWPRIFSCIIQQTTGLAVPINTERLNPTAQEIRECLNNQYNQPAIKQIIQLNLDWCALTCIPIELSLFTGLTRLDIKFSSQLHSINIPNTLTNLQGLHLGWNRLSSIKIPNTLIKLGAINLQNNQLTSMEIPDTLIHLKELNASNNPLTSIIIPSTLENLQELKFNSEELDSIVISDRISNIIQANLANQKNKCRCCTIS